MHEMHRCSSWCMLNIREIKQLMIMNILRHFFLALLVVSSTISMKVRVLSGSRPKLRHMPSIYKPIKLPVWPVWSGVIAQCFDWLKAHHLSENIVSTVGGRVVPITLSENNVSPFLLLAHHSHSFTPFDPVRAMTRFFLPEGFPAHPHSGFDTVTYCIDGGLRHRDSEGIKMSYGDGDVQWMRAGRGVIHEEMWDLFDSAFKHKRIEIFQLWVNLPSKSKANPPAVHVLKSQDIPRINISGGGTLKVISGQVVDDNDRTVCGPGYDIAQSPVVIGHLSIPNGDGLVRLAAESDCPVTVYVRRGSLIVENENTDVTNSEQQQSVEVTHGDYVVYRTGDSSGSAATGTESEDGIQEAPLSDTPLSEVMLRAGSRGLDALILVGKPIKEPVLWSGPLVQADENSFRRSAAVFNSIGRGAFWDQTISDAEWKAHCEKLRLQDIITSFENLR